MRIGAPGPWTAAELGRGVLAGLPHYGLALWVLAAVVGALVPMPALLVDLLLTLSLAGSTALLVASLAARRSADFLGFPTLLILVTLSRLSLNVTTTRMILTEGDAGRVIDAFATLVIREDLIVGAVMFAIFLVVQLAVVARGAERIAEVAARFALDGLPGHQAAIEADLRAGALTPAEAGRRRARLLDRSSFYGAMDGAVRFTRYDAIAALSITAINLVGGTAAGVLRGGLGLGEALDRYGRLTIGDGLVTQVPSLLVSLAAAVLVARVDREEPVARRGGGPAPGVLAAPAGLLLALALAPGMPRAAFVATGLALGGGALALAWGRRAPAPAGRRIVVWLAGHGPEDIRALHKPLAQLRRRCAGTLGIEVPEIVAAAAREPGAPGLVVRLGERILGVPEDMPEGADAEAVVIAVFRAVMRDAEALFDLQALEAAVEAARAQQPAVVREALQAVGPADLLALVRGLLRERVPLPGFAALLEAVAAEPCLRQASERGRWVTALRERLAGWYVRDVVAGWARLGPVVWARPRPDAEAALLARVVAEGGEVRLRLSPVERRDWRLRVCGGHEDGPPPLLVCSSRARPAFAALMDRAAPHVAVLAAGELQAVDLAVPGEPGGPPARWFDAPGEPGSGAGSGA